MKRLKDTDGALYKEAMFWASQLAKLVEAANATHVSNPPSSQKVGRTRHLATDLAVEVARLVGLPYAEAFKNLDPHGKKLPMALKLAQGGEYAYIGPPEARILLVDDYYCTGSTLGRCVKAAGLEKITGFVALAGS